MIVLSTTLKTFDNKVNKIKSLAKKKYYLQKTLENINEDINIQLYSVHVSKNEYIEKRAPVYLNHIKFNLSVVLPERKRFRTHVLTLLKELEH